MNPFVSIPGCGPDRGHYRCPPTPSGAAPALSCLFACTLLLALVHGADAPGSAAAPLGPPRRVLSLCTSVTDTIVRLGETGRLAGIDEYSRVVPGATHLPVLGRGSALSREQVLAREIDLAFVWWFQEDVAHLLADLRVPVVSVRCQRAGDVPATIRLVGRHLACTERADALAQSVAAQIAGLSSIRTHQAPRVYVELYSPLKTSGLDTYLNDLIELAGGRNIAADASGPVLLSAERLLAADPQCVVLMAGFGTAADFARRGGFESLSAVQARRVHVVDRYCLVAGAGVADGVAVLSGLFHPRLTP